ncbi:BREX-1 system adenine-specific DNA-methyltransferase PglX [Bacillus wiedmannii]|uniref:BREX-1 system adenine-specific DNA-methyltransferase PglX n=1 Tax=Bacillus wiedmannii TaxID=1890302 RepID=UPI00272F3F5D|nr:BREX-1 system adenine-specific DNA-methyltransferase PglX [Bacillus wiedmannii]MDP1455748.1 BREX-1 system adenine-specific DNA-methyltransferase PglX [Bacillus wiedmannii]
MNKKALKEFAVYARNELREQIALRAQAFGITSEGSPALVTGADYVEINGNKYAVSYKNSIQKLLKEVEVKGYDNVIEEVAYTWFNRLIAIRYMEVHNYLPSKVRVLSSETKGKVDPDILTEHQYTDLPVSKDEVTSLLAQGNREGAFRKLLVAQCNELNEIMPFLFEKLADFTELLLPESLLHADSLINKLGKELEDGNFEYVEVIGWLYQYYISEKKDEVFAGLKKNKKITKENIPAATQLFTPHWIVRYMVENSLGQMWLESYPESKLKDDMQYYVEPAGQEPEVQAKLEELRNPNLSPEEITIMDPACGSGHILVYAFDLLYKIYEERGYPTKEIPLLILEKNLYGIDIDDRATQLASFALMMKAREKTRKIFRDVPNLNIISIQESNNIWIERAADLIGENDNEKEEVKELLATFIDAKNFGSILQPAQIDFQKYIKRIDELQKEGEYNLDTFEVIEQLGEIRGIFQQAELLVNEYHVVLANPPYMSAKGMNPDLNEFTRNCFSKFKSDLFSIYMYRYSLSTKEGGFNAYMTPMVWLFIKSYEDLRKFILNNKSVYSLVQLHYDAFTAASVPICVFTLRNIKLNYKGSYIKLTDFYGEKLQPKKVVEAIENPKVNYKFILEQSKFNDIPSSPLAYWASEKVIKIFREYSQIGDLGILHEGIKTRDNERFLRFWYEVNVEKSTVYSTSKSAENRKWFPYSKGGNFRKWYGNNEYVINWELDGLEVKNFKKSSGTNSVGYFNLALTWNSLSSHESLAFRLINNSLWGGGGSGFTNIEPNFLYYLLGLTNSKVSSFMFRFFTSTMNREVGQISKIPFKVEQEKKDRVDSISQNCYEISRMDWDSFETSWDFKCHPFCRGEKDNSTLMRIYEIWEAVAENQFHQLQKNEEELNEIFIELYGLQGELTSSVPDEEIKIRRADRVRDTKSFLSYCIGLMMGRYSLDVEGIAYAGGEWETSKYKTFQPDSDGIIPLTDTEYFEDDVVTRLQELLVLMFGQDALVENLRWLAESLTMKNNETPVERLRRYFFDEFYSDHCKIYQKRPIYWMADSGKKKGFRALFYLHRYTPETLATMRFSYVQNLQEKLNQEQKRLDQDLVNPDLTAAMKKRYNKQLTTITAQQDELIDFDKKMAELANQRIALDLDDGVVVNYKKIEGVLAKIK